MNGVFFLHGLDSSGNGTKGQFFAKNFPHIKRPDFTGTLEERLFQLQELCSGFERLIFIGSSFGGLMAACYAANHPQQLHRLVLLAPAFNFAGYEPPAKPLKIDNLTVIGRNDTVTPPHLVIPKARHTFVNPDICEVDDDHFLHHTFAGLNWQQLTSFETVPGTNQASDECLPEQS